MRNCFFIISIFCANCNITFALFIFSWKSLISNQFFPTCFILNVNNFPIKSFLTFGNLLLIFHPYQKVIFIMQYCYFTFRFWYDRMCSVKKNNKVTLQLICWETLVINQLMKASSTDIFDILSYTHQRQRKR